MLFSVYNPKNKEYSLFYYYQLYLCCYLLYDAICMLDNPKTSFCSRHLKMINKINTHTLTTDVYDNKWFN